MTRSLILMSATTTTLVSIAHFITFTVIGLSWSSALIYVLLLNILTEILGRINVRLKDISLSNELRKVNIIKIGEEYLVQPLNLRVGRRIALEINLGGALIPLIISLVLITYLTINYTYVGLYICLLLLIMLSLVVNRLSVAIKGLGLAVPIFITSTIISGLSISAVLTCGLPPNTAVLYAYVVSYTSVLVGVDLLNLRRLLVYNVRRLIIGGLKLYDALILIPASSSIMTYVAIIITIYITHIMGNI